ncbi:hypothetical protein DFH08DRAFT_940551 [Mycena albidolilacea]|uniref:Uncharacterized protein n=1 Tax=Mycena albidolilacea TaxID=1033008 RepID=A0AAD7EKE9_9AGAR|nr:hypothetical protein DFH08DRAFT_940551 [Mycena albidolilacea]
MTHPTSSLNPKNEGQEPPRLSKPGLPPVSPSKIEPQPAPHEDPEDSSLPSGSPAATQISLPFAPDTQLIGLQPDTVLDIVTAQVNSEPDSDLTVDLESESGSNELHIATSQAANSDPDSDLTDLSWTQSPLTDLETGLESDSEPEESSVSQSNYQLDMVTPQASCQWDAGSDLTELESDSETKDPSYESDSASDSEDMELDTKLRRVKFPSAAAPRKISRPNAKTVSSIGRPPNRSITGISPASRLRTRLAQQQSQWKSDADSGSTELHLVVLTRGKLPFVDVGVPLPLPIVSVLFYLLVSLSIVAAHYKSAAP